METVTAKYTKSTKANTELNTVLVEMGWVVANIIERWEGFLEVWREYGLRFGGHGEFDLVEIRAGVRVR